MSQANSRLYQSRQLEIEITRRDTRIRQLERLNATLSAEVDRVQSVVDAAWIAMRFGKGTSELHAALLAYEASQPK